MYEGSPGPSRPGRSRGSAAAVALATTTIHSLQLRAARSFALLHMRHGLLLAENAPDCKVTNEPRRQACGAPDYVVAWKGVVVGFVEAKDIGIDLDKGGEARTTYALPFEQRLPRPHHRPDRHEYDDLCDREAGAGEQGERDRPSYTTARSGLRHGHLPRAGARAHRSPLRSPGRTIERLGVHLMNG
jgi:hypothetical protein